MTSCESLSHHNQSRPYGTWHSPITSDAIVQNAAPVDELFVDPITSTIYHIEGRPSEGGRSVIVNTEAGRDVVGKEWNTRTRVHEYGGAPAVAYDGTIYFSNFGDNRVYKVKEGGQPEPITPDNLNHRFAKFAVHPKQTHLLVAILEDHTHPRPADVVNTLCVINSREKTVSSVVSGADFYSFPCFTPDGTRIAWQQWFHPDMPWEGAEIHVADVAADAHTLTVTNASHVAGKNVSVSAGYPIWASNNLLLFTSDISGYQNPWTYSVSSGKASAVLSTPKEEDFAMPAWSLGRNYGVPLDLEGKMALFTAVRGGRSVLYVVSLRGGTLEEVASPYVSIAGIRRVTHDAAVFIGATSDEPSGIVLCRIQDYARPKFSTLKATAAAPDFPHSLFSVAQSIALKAPSNGEPLHVLYYPPTNPDYEGPAGEKPPCVISVHGGPTSAETPALNMTKQLFTSRGWAWVDVNYGGSSGYGRKYIKRLEGQWGVVDVDDCVLALQLLSAPPFSLIDPQRTAIRGGSAGGYTALEALCSYPDAFAAGTSSYGISDLVALGEETHKFESNYGLKLLGGTPEEVPEVYKARSPVNNASKIRSPLLVLQGELDAVVPPAQAEAIVQTIRSQGGRIEYTVFQGEGHGWRKAENIKAALDQELAFYEDVFGLKAV
ncbi:Dipeptidyl peptidase family member 6 [Grifola frondosa]|uniref:Dipeptidyl peptidase family member 6 n=1 Tax=Grifola frondosa TaxID=5627 RepID=A0A1C7MJ16_GRIFR|nr:Dipeptidyl peptidase family member 6 [Grifola frondosa]